MKLYNPFKINNASITLIISTIIVLMVLFYGAVFITFLLPGGIWLTISLIVIPALGRTLYAIFKGK
jgi:hypothetical protein